MMREEKKNKWCCCCRKNVFHIFTFKDCVRFLEMISMYKQIRVKSAHNYLHDEFSHILRPNTLCVYFVLVCDWKTSSSGLHKDWLNTPCCWWLFERTYWTKVMLNLWIAWYVFSERAVIAYAICSNRISKHHTLDPETDCLYILR